MALKKRLMLAVAALVSMAIAAPAIANEDGAPLLVTAYHPAARAATVRELLTVPTTMPAPGQTLEQFLDDHVPARVPLPALETQWSTAVPSANRKLANCLFLRSEWNAAHGVASGSLDNRCNLSLRIRATYGFRSGKGACEPIDRADGVLMPAFGRRQITWQGSDDRTQTACIAAIEIFGIPQWTIEQAQAARGWLIDEARGGFLTDLTLYDKEGSWEAMGSGLGKVTAAQSDQPCELTLSSPDFTRSGGAAEQRLLTIRWADVSRVEDVSYNQFVNLTFKDAVGREAWSLEFSNFKPSLAATGFDGTVAASILTEYCRAKETL